MIPLLATPRLLRMSYLLIPSNLSTGRQGTLRSIISNKSTISKIPITLTQEAYLYRQGSLASVNKHPAPHLLLLGTNFSLFIHTTSQHCDSSTQPIPMQCTPPPSGTALALSFSMRTVSTWYTMLLHFSFMRSEDRPASLSRPGELMPGTWGGDK